MSTFLTTWKLLWWIVANWAICSQQPTSFLRVYKDQIIKNQRKAKRQKQLYLKVLKMKVKVEDQMQQTVHSKDQQLPSMAKSTCDNLIKDKLNSVAKFRWIYESNGIFECFRHRISTKNLPETNQVVYLL